MDTSHSEEKLPKTETMANVTAKRSAQPNCLEYMDDKGVKHSIYLPQGTMQAAFHHLENKRWDELEKFAPYTVQGYTDEDFQKPETNI